MNSYKAHREWKEREEVFITKQMTANEAKLTLETRLFHFVPDSYRRVLLGLEFLNLQIYFLIHIANIESWWGLLTHYVLIWRHLKWTPRRLTRIILSSRRQTKKILLYIFFDRALISTRRTLILQIHAFASHLIFFYFQQNLFFVVKYLHKRIKANGKNSNCEEEEDKARERKNNSLKLINSIFMLKFLCFNSHKTRDSFLLDVFLARLLKWWGMKWIFSR